MSGILITCSGADSQVRFIPDCRFKYVSICTDEGVRPLPTDRIYSLSLLYYFKVQHEMMSCLLSPIIARFTNILAQVSTSLSYLSSFSINGNFTQQEPGFSFLFISIVKTLTLTSKQGYRCSLNHCMLKLHSHCGNIKENKLGLLFTYL